MKRWLFWVWLAVLSTASSGFSAGLIIVDDTSWWQGPNPPHFGPPRPVAPWPMPPRRPYAFAPLVVASVKVNAHISDQLAVTTLEQEFYNPNAARLEGTFVFPVPKGAHLNQFAMEIDGKPVEAELLAADKGRRIYEDIVRKMRDPALLEYADRDLFKVRIFPIEPNSRKRITISYTQLLKADDGLLSYVLPLSTEKFSSKPVNEVSVRVELESKRPLKSIYSPSHKVEIKREGANRAIAGYEASHAQPDADFALYFAPEKDEIGLNLLTYKTGTDDGYFLLLASPGVSAQEQGIVSKDVVFVLDTSGSMAGKKLEQAKKALEFCVENLNQGDRFQLIRFSTEVEPLFDGLLDANRQNRDRAEDFVKKLKPTGATAIDDALRKALELRPGRPGTADAPNSGRPFVVIFLTDGRPTIGTTDEDQILAHVKQANNGKTRVFCFGIGTDVNTHLLDRITEETRGVSQYVLPEEDLEVKVSSFFTKINEPVLADPTLKFTGDIRATRLYPNPLPDLFKGEQLVLVGRYSGQGDSAVIIEGTVNGKPRKFTYDVKFANDSVENDFIPRLWATRRVGYLLDEIRLHGENSELRDEVTDLARQYGIVTPYTAYLIVEDETRRNVPVPLRSLNELEKDRAVRAEAGRSWQMFKNERGGDAGVASALSGQSLKMADAPAAATAGAEAAFRRRYGLANPANSPATSQPAPETVKLNSYSQQAQFVGGKTFFQNGNQWLDSAIQKAADAKRISLQIGTQDYFDFVAKNPRALPWLALGQNVQFLLDGIVYEIHE
jgi:Ca-activated chloride channel homolog